MDGESESLRRQLSSLEQIIQAEMEKGKVLQVCSCAPGPHCLPAPVALLCDVQIYSIHARKGEFHQSK